MHGVGDLAGWGAVCKGECGGVCGKVSGAPRIGKFDLQDPSEGFAPDARDEVQDLRGLLLSRSEEHTSELQSRVNAST